MAVSPLLLMLVVVLSAPLPLCVLSAPDSKGTEFFLCYMENTNRFKQDVELYISTSSNIPATVTVTLPLFQPDWIRTIIVSRENVRNLTLPNAIRGEGVEKSNKGVWVRSTREISLYAVNLEPTSTDAYIVLPVDVLGKEYYAMTYQRDPVIMLVGVENNTQVSIKWPRFRWNRFVYIDFRDTIYQNGETLTVTLNQFETLHIYQDSYTSDFTGAYITSLKPIAVLSGNRRVYVPITAAWSDHLTEMLMPVNTWGRDFISTSTPTRSSGDVYRIVASESNTRLDFTGVGTFTLLYAGDFQEIDIRSGHYAKITATKPVMIAMFAKSWRNDGIWGGDPAMTMIIPVPQYGSDYTWAAVSSALGDFNNMVVVIVEENKKDGLRLDGYNVTWEEEKRVAGSTKLHLWAHVTPGTHNLYHTDPMVTFMLYASGARLADSYAFLGGMRMADINSVCEPSCVEAGDVVDNDCDGRVDEEALNDLDDDDDGRIDEDLALPPREDGQWGEWEPWGPCSVSCGSHGVKIRTRACDNPAPANNGFFCPGSCAAAFHCHAQSCPKKPREVKTCELTSGQVVTFKNVQGRFTYNCLFKAATLDRYKVAGSHKLKIDIFAAYKDVDQSGDFYVSEVVVVVQEICLHLTPGISRFTITADRVRDVYSGVNQIEDPKDLWTIDDVNGYRDVLCFGYDNGRVTFDIKVNKATCIRVLTFLPLIQSHGGTPGVVITVESHMLSTLEDIRFPNTSCSGRWDKAFDEEFKGLDNSQQKLLYALLDQNVPQPQSDTHCVAAVQAFQGLTDSEKKTAAERCESTNLEHLATCISGTAAP